MVSEEIIEELQQLRAEIISLKTKNAKLEKTKNSLTEATEFLAYALRRHKKYAEEIREQWNEAVKLVLDVSTVAAKLELAIEKRDKEIERLINERIQLSKL